jgi:hypothetical protein
MCANNCTLRTVASTTADDANQRAAVRIPGLIARDSTPFEHPEESLYRAEPRPHERASLCGTGFRTLDSCALPGGGTDVTACCWLGSDILWGQDSSTGTQ